MCQMISWWVRNPKAANLLMAAIIIVGIATFSRIEQEVFQKSLLLLYLSIMWPGASPKEVERPNYSSSRGSLRDIEGVEKIRAFAQEVSVRFMFKVLQEQMLIT